MSLAPEDFGKVGVLMGGWAAEREISLLSGNAVLSGLRSRGVDAHGIDVGRDIVSVLSQQDFDRVFIVLHGRGGEDGVIQGALEVLQIPYTGSAVLGSAIGMDKYRSKLLWQGMGLPTPGFAVIQQEADLATAAELGFPLMVKPIREGSSIGISKVDDIAQLKDAWLDAAKFDRQVLAERWITGSEYTVAILAEQALPPIKLETDNLFYDYQAKYQSDDTRYLIPCGLDQQAEQDLKSLALRAFRAVDAKGWGRIDIMVDEESRPWLIEVNTVPGMTDHSLVPMAAKAEGLDFAELAWRILAQTMETEG